MRLEDRWAVNGGVRLHYLDGRGDDQRGLAPLLYVPGFLGAAEEFAGALPRFGPRRCVAVSLFHHHMKPSLLQHFPDGCSFH